MSHNNGNLRESIVYIIVPHLQECEKYCVQYKNVHPLGEDCVFELVLEEGTDPYSWLFEPVYLRDAQDLEDYPGYEQNYEWSEGKTCGP